MRLKKKKRGIIMSENIKIKIDDNTLKDLLNESKVSYDFTDEDPDIIISEKIPSDQRPFIVIWDKHDVDKIDKLISDYTQSRYLRGFFLKQDVKQDASALIEIINKIVEEIKSVNELKDKAKKIIEEKQYFEVGSIVKISKKSGSQLALEYGNPRFTTLFIDEPMIELMKQVGKILEEIRPQIEKLYNHYKNYIEEVEKTGGIVRVTRGPILTTFNTRLVEGLNRNMNTNPIKLDPILLTGETGSGKTLLARWIHERIISIADSKISRPIQEINSSALTGNLLESELFGHVEGAWTDARTTKPGKALLALGGVLFFDEIGDMPLDIQPRVMKFIDEKTFTPEGWTGLPFYTPLLVIGATNKDLGKEVENGRFRSDFYARFKHRVHVPSIEERKRSLNAIIDLLLQNPFINPVKNCNGYTIKYVSHNAIKKLKEMNYPENFRGLERIIRDAAYRTRDYGLEIILEDLIEG